MIDYRYITALVVLLFVGPLFVAGYFTDHSAAKPKAKMVKEQQVEVAVPVLMGAPFALPQGAPGPEGVFDAGGLNAQRAVKISVNTTLDALLQPGESRPKAAYTRLYAAARAAQYMNRYCQDILAVIGAQCVVSTARFEAIMGNELRLSAVFFYTPSYDMGTLQAGSGVEVKQILTRPELAEGRVLSSQKASHEFVQNTLQAALARCQELKEKFGNCVISEVKLNASDLNQDESKLRYRREVRRVPSLSIQFGVHTGDTIDLPNYTSL